MEVSEEEWRKLRQATREQLTSMSWQDAQSLMKTAYQNRQHLFLRSDKKTNNIMWKLFSKFFKPETVIKIQQRNGITIQEGPQTLSIGAGQICLDNHPIHTEKQKQRALSLFRSFLSRVALRQNADIPFLLALLFSDPEKMKLLSVKQMAMLRSSHPSFRLLQHPLQQAFRWKTKLAKHFPPSFINKLDWKSLHSSSLKYKEQGADAYLVMDCFLIKNDETTIPIQVKMFSKNLEELTVSMCSKQQNQCFEEETFILSSPTDQHYFDYMAPSLAELLNKIMVADRPQNIRFRFVRVSSHAPVYRLILI